MCLPNLTTNYKHDRLIKSLAAISTWKMRDASFRVISMKRTRFLRHRWKRNQVIFLWVDLNSITSKWESRRFNWIKTENRWENKAKALFTSLKNADWIRGCTQSNLPTLLWIDCYKFFSHIKISNRAKRQIFLSSMQYYHSQRRIYCLNDWNWSCFQITNVNNNKAQP